MYNINLILQNTQLTHNNQTNTDSNQNVYSLGAKEYRINYTGRGIDNGNI